MTQTSAHSDDPHYVTRSGWLRAAVLGANDGIVSVSSLIVGVATADPSPKAVLIAGAAGLTAGAMSMAAGEYVSVSSQSDIERADIKREEIALAEAPEDALKCHRLTTSLSSCNLQGTNCSCTAAIMLDSQSESFMGLCHKVAE